MSNSLPLLVIVGPTATGKTALAIALAQRLDTEILSADSRQVYRGMDIGTAKPTLAERAGVIHHLIDLCTLDQTYTVAQYQTAARDLVAKLHGQGRTPILAGGTGLYIQAVTAGLVIPPVPPAPALRAGLEPLSAPELHNKLQGLDPQRATQIHPQDRVRLLRALEIYLTLGYSPPRRVEPPPYPVLTVGLDYLDPDGYTQRLQTRTEAMLAQGWLTELRQLQEMYSPTHPLLKTLGYEQMGAYLAGQVSERAAIQETVLRTRQYAKRQRTWFRRNLMTHWFDTAHQSLDEVVARVQQLLVLP
ncbi:tRNA (adenosine(37)-N6)-dimethylallyltransferase MiaA [Candidatus Cyanaurora vandensis]|uniref:tRNA (adenosine(37)-N6)-dimethylallyltransferase MiaA n=1 Tax=Candidatus Cyanaurora vandensis TaxID=2714958 RepID=UPI00257CF0FB|nr:tRNA (adenosine(37)-N6)-dimethylallyltransferase MiaA [Candidatus Cyanaurora vandensis]